MGEVQQGRVSSLDGMRSLAIIGVLGIHAHAGLVPGGHLGVSVFFVLSGYLITSLLMREWHRAGSINFKHFYIKRSVRLFPALFLVLVTFGIWSLFHNPAGDVLLGVASAAFYFTNVIAAVFGASELAHFEWAWTLSLEEQFYLVWPVLLVAVLPRRWVALSIALAGVVASQIFRMIEPLNDFPPSIYFAPHTRMGGLLLGAALALVLFRRDWIISKIVGNMLALLALAAISGSFLIAGLAEKSTYTVWVPLVELAAAALIFALVRSEGTIFERLLSLKLIARLGLISYGVYLWNVPVIQVVAIFGLPLPLAAPLAIVGTIVLASLSFKYVEQPIQSEVKKRLAGREPVPVLL